MVIVIPMAGLSSRFTKAGYSLPKYMLYAKDKSLFNLAVSSFEKYFKTCKFIFVARDLFDTKTFIEKECEIMGLKNYNVRILEKATKGQAETVLMGLDDDMIKYDESILIFNIDTFRPNFVFPDKFSETDGYLECFEGEGCNWSYAKTEDGSCNSNVIETAEKKEISHFCSTGVYYFKYVTDFVSAFHENEINPINGMKEMYVAPLYNYLIKKGKNIHINLINRNEVFFCGIPEEYISYLKSSLND